MPDDLKVGNYSVSVNYTGDVFKPETKNVTFKVVKADPNLSISVEKNNVSVSYVHVEVDAKEKVNGTVTITMNNVVFDRKLQLVNGHGEFDYANIVYLTGNYTAIAQYEGNENFNADKATTTYEMYY